jgi:hypothetical protein
MRCFHDLETAAACRIDPARVVDDALGQHSARLFETLANGFEMAFFDVFYDHEQHDF